MSTRATKRAVALRLDREMRAAEAPLLGRLKISQSISRPFYPGRCTWCRPPSGKEISWSSARTETVVSALVHRRLSPAAPRQPRGVAVDCFGRGAFPCTDAAQGQFTRRVLARREELAQGGEARHVCTTLKVALDQVRDDSACMTRMERILARWGRQRGIWSGSRREPADVVEGLIRPPESVPGARSAPSCAPSSSAHGSEHLARSHAAPRALPAGTPLGILKKVYGQMTTAIDQHSHHLDQRNNRVCWPTINFGTISGAHGCQYCGAGRGGKFLTVALNLEEFMEKVVGPVIEENPWNKVFRMILDGADSSPSSRNGLHDLFTRKLAEAKAATGISTVSSNVVMADLRTATAWWASEHHGGGRRHGFGTGAAIDRIKAARKVQEMGIGSLQVQADHR